MKKSSSKKLQNKTINTDNDSKTTKKSINRSESCMKISKHTMKESRKIDQNQILKENTKLREEFCRLQSLHLKDKEKIKHLISRISETRRDREIMPETPPKEKN